MDVINGEQLGNVGFEKLGTPYSEMDCQAFVEWCFRKCGYNKDAAGSNAWYRFIRENGAIMTPEDCVQQLGTVPKGAILFIWANDGGEEKRGYHDGLGNASHMGICTGSRGKGAIASSQSRGCVAESEFHNRSIKGGWNRVGLPTFVMYDYTKGGNDGFPVDPGWHPTVRRGDRGTDVAYVQAILQQLGYDLGPAGVDGDFGPKTEEAVIVFQKKNGLIADGVVGPMTYQALEEAEPEQDDGDRWTVIIPDIPENEKDALLTAYPWAKAEKGRG